MTVCIPAYAGMTERAGGRHTGFKAVSTGRGDNKPTPTDRIPLSLDGRGIKGEGENETVPSLHPVDSRLRGNDGPACHCGLDPPSRGADATRHAEYLLDTTVAQDRSRVGRNP